MFNAQLRHVEAFGAGIRDQKLRFPLENVSMMPSVVQRGCEGENYHVQLIWQGIATRIIEEVHLLISDFECIVEPSESRQWMRGLSSLFQETPGKTDFVSSSLARGESLASLVAIAPFQVVAF